MSITGAETYIGKDEWTDSLYLNGSMSAIWVWKNRKLLKNEVTELYNRQSAGIDIL